MVKLFINTETEQVITAPSGTENTDTIICGLWSIRAVSIGLFEVRHDGVLISELLTSVSEGRPTINLL